MIAKIGPVHPEILDDIRQTTTWTRNAISITMFSAETTRLIFTKILHDIVALVASRSKMKPCDHLANVQRMHVVSVCLHFGNIIWLPWQRPLTNWKIKYRSIIHKVFSYGEKIAKFGPVRPQIFNEIHQTTMWKHNPISIRIFFSETTGPIFTKILHDVVALVALCSFAHTRRYPIPFLNDTAISAGGVGNFASFLPLNCLPWQRPLRNRKKWTWSRKFTQIPSIWWKGRENRFSRYWDSFAPIKKKKLEMCGKA